MYAERNYLLLTAVSTTDPTSTEPQTPAEDLIRQIYGLAALRRELGRVASGELSTPGFGALVALHRGQASRVSDLASVLQIDQSVASRQVAALQAAGFVERTVDPDDRRAHLLGVTDAGRAALGDVHQKLTDALGDALRAWDPDDVVVLARGLERLIASFDELHRC